MFILTKDNKILRKGDIVENFSMDYLKKPEYKWIMGAIVIVAVCVGVYYYKNNYKEKKKSVFY